MTDSRTNQGPLDPSDTFLHRHIAPTAGERAEMLATLKLDDLKTLIDQAVPAAIRMRGELELDVSPGGDGRELGEYELLAGLREIAGQNELKRSLIGMGYHDCIVPPVIARNVLEDPGWYTQYTPYQAEISQGRLELVLNFQTMVADLAGMEMANASLLDESTACAEAISMCYSLAKRKRDTVFVDAACHPQSIAVVQTRASAMGLQVEIGDPSAVDWSAGKHFAALVQYPDTEGRVRDYAELASQLHSAGAYLITCADLLALTVLKAPGRFGADVCVGTTQRFGVPMGFGGPHAGYLATQERFKRAVPGRIIGVSRDRTGRRALRMAMQTREQHIRREKAGSNICTAQVLLAIMAGLYGAWHGPDGLRRIATRVHGLAQAFATGARRLGFAVESHDFFDAVNLSHSELSADQLMARAESAGFNLRRLDALRVQVSFDEKSTGAEVEALWRALAGNARLEFAVADLAFVSLEGISEGLRRESSFMEHEVFHRYHAEHEMLRYLHRLKEKDLSLTTSMIPLGSCTMKLNATSEMLPITWPEFADMHPFAPSEQSEGYRAMLSTLENWLCEITGFAGCSLQPNAGSQGELAGLLSIRAYHRDRGDDGRTTCLIPVSAHGTNPASAVMAGMKVVVVACDEQGNVDVEDLRSKAEKHASTLAAIMITYPSTHGVFEAGIREICDAVHQHGGLVYLDGANMNAQVGLCRPGDYGADVCHLNLHKTFCIPHGGGGPGMGPICSTEALRPFLPGHPIVDNGTGDSNLGTIAGAPWGSAAILPISWVYIALMGPRGLKEATEVAILNANYMAARLGDSFPVLYSGDHGRVAHEFIVDLRPLEATSGVSAEDVAKRLMDYGFHAPTMSFPVAGTLMIEPTESESKAELDRLCDALIAIRSEIARVEAGELDRADNPLKNAPHTAVECTSSEWSHGYSREEAAFPAPWLRDHKYWPTVARVDNAWGDRNLVCSCPPIESYSD